MTFFSNIPNSMPDIGHIRTELIYIMDKCPNKDRLQESRI